MSSRWFATGDTSSSDDDDNGYSAPYHGSSKSNSGSGAAKKPAGSSGGAATGLAAYVELYRNAILKKDWTSAKEAFDELMRKMPSQPTIPAMKIIVQSELEVGATVDDRKARSKLSQTAIKALEALNKQIASFLDKHAELAEKVTDMLAEEADEEDEEEQEEPQAGPTSGGLGGMAKVGFEADDDDDFMSAKPKPAGSTSQGKKSGSPYHSADLGDEEEEQEEKDYDDDKDDDDDTDDDWMNMDEDDINLPAVAHKITRAFWLKKEPTTNQQQQQSQKTASHDERRAQRQAEAERRKATAIEEEGSEDEEEDDELTTRDGMDANEEISPEQMARRVHDVWSLRGRKGEMGYIRQTVEYLLTKTDDPFMILQLKLLDVITAFDANINKNRGMPITSWNSCVEQIQEILKLLATNPKVKLLEDDTESLVSTATDFGGSSGFNFLQLEALGFEDPFSQRKQQAEAANAKKDARSDADAQYVEGSIYSLVFKAFTEHNRALCQIENPAQNTAELATRLREQPKLIRLLKNARDYYARQKKTQVEALVASMWLELEYFRYQPALDVASPGYTKPANGQSPVDELAEVVMRSSDPYSRARAILMQIYHWAVHNRYQEARSLFISSQLPHFINDADIKTRILFNRTMVQIGMAAFRAGEYKQAMQALLDLFEHSAKRFNVELIAQGIAPRMDAREEEIQEAKRRVLPYHMHFNTENVEAVFYVSAMLVDVPSIAEHGWHLPKQVQSRAFRRAYIRFTEALASNSAHTDFQRDVPMHAAKALFEGDWKQCVAHLDRLKLWATMPNADKVKALLHAEVQKVALRTFLLTYGAHFASLPLKMLVEDFALPEAVVSKIISQLMHQDLLRASWDRNSETILIHQAPPSRLGVISQLFVERIGQMLEANERVLGSASFHDGGAPGSGTSYGYGRRQDRYSHALSSGSGRYQSGRRWGDRSRGQQGSGQGRGKNPRGSQQRAAAASQSAGSAADY